MNKKMQTGFIRATSPNEIVAVSSTSASFDAVIANAAKSKAPPSEAIGYTSRMRLRAALALVLQSAAGLRETFAQRTKKRLCVAESISLGEKRFVALLEIDGQEFLIGGGTTGISVLATLDKTLEALAVRENRQ